MFPQEDNADSISDTTENRKSPQKEALESDILNSSRNYIQPDSVTVSDKLPEDSIQYEKSELENNVELLDDKKIDEDLVTNEGRNEYDQVIPEDEKSNLSNVNTSTLEVVDEEDSRPKKNKLTTPAKRLTRRSVPCCIDGTVTPLLSRLRPRTPCSRSTRRSLSAHCDMPHEFCTPAKRSARKTPRRSVSKAAKRQSFSESNIGSSASITHEEGGVIAAERLPHDNEGLVDAANTSVPHLNIQNTPGITLNVLPLKEESPLMTPG